MTTRTYKSLKQEFFKKTCDVTEAEPSTADFIKMYKHLRNDKI